MVGEGWGALGQALLWVIGEKVAPTPPPPAPGAQSVVGKIEPSDFRGTQKGNHSGWEEGTSESGRDTREGSENSGAGP